MRVLWTHNFPPDVLNAGNFMRTFANGLRSLGVTVDLHYLGRLGSPLDLAMAARQLRGVASGHDIVHAQFGSACGLVTAAANRPTVLSLRGSDWHRYRGPAPAEARHARLATSLSRSVLSRYSAIVTMSERMTVEIGATRRELSVRTIPDPIDVDLFAPRDRGECRMRMFQTNVDEPWVLFTSVARSNPVKRVELAVEAVRRARQRLPGLELKVASGIAHAQMPLFVSACDVVLCTSTHEGWPNSVKEGLACGLPFVSTDVSDLRQVADRHESCRIVSDDPDDIADGILHAVRFSRQPGLRAEAASMSVEASSRRMLELYQFLLQGRRN